MKFDFIIRDTNGDLIFRNLDTGHLIFFGHSQFRYTTIKNVLQLFRETNNKTIEFIAQVYTK